MNYKKLITPVFRVRIGEYEIQNGILVECFSSKKTCTDWCRIELAEEIAAAIEFQDMAAATLEMGYDDDFDTLITGYVKKNKNKNELFLKDDMIFLQEIGIKATFLNVTPQDIIRYILTSASIQNYKLSQMEYGKKNIFTVNQKNGIQAITEVGAAWGIENEFYFQDKIFYWGEKRKQEEIYTLEENETIMFLNQYGDMWEAETIAIPWIHHSDNIIVKHNKYMGEAEVKKTIVRNDHDGNIRMYIYF